MKFRRKFFAKALLLVLIIALSGWIVMRLWNWIIPGLVVGAQTIDYPHAIGLLVLCRILFGGFRGHGGCYKARQWRHWQQMTQQERERLRNDSTSNPTSNPTSNSTSAARPGEGAST